MSSENERRFHTDTRTSKNFTEDGLRTRTGQPPSKWGRYTLKELLDNALDFGGETPEIRVELDVTPGSGFSIHDRIGRVLVRDDGPGIPPERLEQIADVDKFGGSKQHYNLPDRGKQGNALMTLIGIQYLCGGRPLHIAAQNNEYQVTTSEKPLHGDYETTVERVGDSQVAGTEVEVVFGDEDTGYTRYDRVKESLERFIALNPHAHFTVVTDDAEVEEVEHPPVDAPTREQLSMPDSATTGKATWFSPNGFTTRLEADARARLETSEPHLSIEEFVGEFRGVSGRTKRKEIANETFGGLHPKVETIGNLFDGDGSPRETAIKTLHAAMCQQTSAFADDGLGSTIGSIGDDLRHRISRGVGQCTTSWMRRERPAGKSIVETTYRSTTAVVRW
jgi:hypothetical protein